MPDGFNEAAEEACGKKEANPEAVLDGDEFAVEGQVVDAADDDYLESRPCYNTERHGWRESSLEW